MHILRLMWQFLATRGRRRTLSVRTVHRNPPTAGLETEYVGRLDEREAELERCRALHRRFWIYLIASASAATATGLLALSSQMGVGWIVPPLAVAAVSFQTLTRNARLHSQVSRILAFYQSGIERLANQWQGRGVSGEKYMAAEHLYAADLDVCGAGSLFEMLCTARTGIGRGMLAKWLLYPAHPGEILQRQQGVAELRDRIDLHEEWASIGEVSVENVEASHLSEWGSAASTEGPPFCESWPLSCPLSCW
jgi:hypothetical protein